MEQQLRKLRQHVLVASSSSSAAAMAGALEGVARVYGEHAEPLARSAARAGQHWVEDELEASVALLDACAAARDALGAMRASAVAAEAAARRRDGAAADTAARAYARLAKTACADARRQRRLAGARSSSRPPAESSELDDGGHALQEARRLTVAVLERVVVALSRRVPAVVAGGGRRRRSSAASSWSTRVVARVLRRTARVACDEDDAAGDMVTAGSLSCKDSRDGEAALRDLRALVDTIRQLEDGLELLFRRLVQCRVCLLNTRSF